MKLAILSDIHGNLSALEAVLKDINTEHQVDGYILLGDLIDYGPHSNEVIELINNLNKPVLCNIWGNHEKAVMDEEYDRFSSDRGRACAKFTLKNLSEASKEYIRTKMNSEGILAFSISANEDEDAKNVTGTTEFSILAVHGSYEDHYWKSIKPETAVEGYENYDLVLSGHSHEPHFFEKYSKTDCPETRNRKKTIFINPGSVGQPRNINSHAQYALFDTEAEEVRFLKVSYDINKEMGDFSPEVDEFYKTRLIKGV